MARTIFVEKQCVELNRCFEYLIHKTQNLTSLNEAQREVILADLNYFLKQSLTDPKHRHHKDAIKNKWKDFERKVIRTSLLKEPKGFFLGLYDFIGIPHSSRDDAKEIAHFDKWEMKDFFEDLLREFENRKSFFSADEALIAYCGLKFLLSEAKISAMKRDQEGIRRTFGSVRPVLEKYGCFYKYAGAKALSSRLRLFVTGSL